MVSGVNSTNSAEAAIAMIEAQKAKSSNTPEAIESPTPTTEQPSEAPSPVKEGSNKPLTSNPDEILGALDDHGRQNFELQSSSGNAGLGGWLKDKAEDVKDVVVDTAGDVADVVVDKAGDAKDTVVSTVTTVASPVVSAVTTVASPVINTVSAGAGLVEDVWNWGSDTAIDTVESMIDFGGDAIQTVVNESIAMADYIPEPIRNVVTSTPTSIPAVVSAVAAPVISNIINTSNNNNSGPVAGETYTVSSGNTLSQIIRSAGIPEGMTEQEALAAVTEANGIANANAIGIGQEIDLSVLSQNTDDSNESGGFLGTGFGPSLGDIKDEAQDTMSSSFSFAGNMVDAGQSVLSSEEAQSMISSVVDWGEASWNLNPSNPEFMANAGQNAANSLMDSGSELIDEGGNFFNDPIGTVGALHQTLHFEAPLDVITSVLDPLEEDADTVVTPFRHALNFQEDSQEMLTDTVSNTLREVPLIGDPVADAFDQKVAEQEWLYDFFVGDTLHMIVDEDNSIYERIFGAGMVAVEFTGLGAVDNVIAGGVRGIRRWGDDILEAGLSFFGRNTDEVIEAGIQQSDEIIEAVISSNTDTIISAGDNGIDPDLIGQVIDTPDGSVRIVQAPDGTGQAVPSSQTAEQFNNAASLDAQNSVIDAPVIVDDAIEETLSPAALDNLNQVFSPDEINVINAEIAKLDPFDSELLISQLNDGGLQRHEILEMISMHEGQLPVAIRNAESQIVPELSDLDQRILNSIDHIEAAPIGQHWPSPEILPAFDNAIRVRGKTPVQGGGGTRTRWQQPDGTILEWDSQHHAVEMYNNRGVHLGEFDPITGLPTKPADPTRNITP